MCGPSLEARKAMISKTLTAWSHPTKPGIIVFRRADGRRLNERHIGLEVPMTDPRIGTLYDQT